MHYFTKKLEFFFLLILFLILISCRKGSDERTENSEDKYSIIVSIYPLYDIVQNLVGDLAEVSFVVPLGANPHNYEPAPSETEKIAGADMIIGISEHFDGWITRIADENADVLYLQEYNHDGTEDHSQEHHDENPHIWLSVRNTLDICKTITYYLAVLDPENKETYQAHFENYTQQLETLDIEFTELFTGISNKSFIQWHPAWNYFAEDYGLEIVGSIESGHDQSPSLRDFENLIKMAIEKNVKVVVISLNAQNTTVNTFVSEIDGTLIQLDSLGNPDTPERSTYINMMRWNAGQLAAALNSID